MLHGVNEHGISPSCFYNAVTRLRKKACQIPDPAPKTALLTLHPINRITDEEIVSVSHFAPIHDIGKTVQTKYHQTKEEALAMYPFYKRQAEEKRIPVFKCTVKEFQSFWRHALDYNKSYHSLIKKYIIPVLGDKRINDVTTEELIKILKETEIPDTKNFPMENILCCMMQYPVSFGMPWNYTVQDRTMVRLLPMP